MSWWLSTGVVGVLLIGYLAALRLRAPGLPAWSGLRTVAWLAGTALVGVALSPPLTDLAHHDLRFHMVQHLLLGMYAPLALVLGAPVTVALGSLSRAGQRRVTGVLRSPVVHVIGHPVSAAVLNVGGMFALYLTPLYALSMDRTAVHLLVLGHFLAAGYLYTWSIAGPDPAPRRPGMAVRVTVLVVAAGAHAYLAKLLYARAVNGADPVGSPHGQPGLSHGGHGHVGGHASSMESAAQWMYYGGDVAEVLLAVMLFTWWYRRRGGPASGRPGRAAPARANGTVGRRASSSIGRAADF